MYSIFYCILIVLFIIGTTGTVALASTTVVLDLDLWVHPAITLPGIAWLAGGLIFTLNLHSDHVNTSPCKDSPTTSNTARNHHHLLCVSP